MKVTAISALHQAMGKVHMNVALDQVHHNRNGTAQAAAHPTTTRIELGPTAAARLIKSDHLDGYAILTPSSSTSIAAQSSNINLLSEPDAVAQEMSSNLRPSMSQSGEALLDITMPDNPLAASTHMIETQEQATIPLALRDLQEQLVAFYEGPNDMVQLETEYTKSEEPFPVPLSKRNEPLSEVAIPMKNADFLFTPNRSQERPLAIPPGDVPHTEIPIRVSELKPKADELGNISIDANNQTFEQLQELRTPELPPEPSFENQQEKLQATSFDVIDPELREQSEGLKHPADEKSSTNVSQSIEALVEQFNLNFN